MNLGVNPLLQFGLDEIEDADVEELFHKEKFITLSTCRTGEGRDKRLLVVAKT